jgi:hypothetical protein
MEGLDTFTAHCVMGVGMIVVRDFLGVCGDLRRLGSVGRRRIVGFEERERVGGRGAANGK